MEFHKPRPVHGWREPLTGIGIIVTGASNSQSKQTWAVTVAGGR
jgi:hypothetical protein